jgi:hypothetical protein
VIIALIIVYFELYAMMYDPDAKNGQINIKIKKLKR